MGHSQDTQNQVFKSSVENHVYQLGYVNHFDIWVPHMWSEKNLLDHISTRNSLLKRMKCSIFKTNCVRKWKVDTVQYCTIMWNGAREMNHHQPHQRSVFIQRRWCCVHGGTGRESSIMNSFWKTKGLIPTSTALSQTNWKQCSTTSLGN